MFNSIFNNFRNVHNKLYSKYFVGLGIVSGFVGGSVNVLEFQVERSKYFNDLANFIEKNHKQPELLDSLQKTNNKINQLKSKTKAGFFESISDSIELSENNREQQNIINKINKYADFSDEFFPPSHPWLNLNDKISVSVAKSLLFGGFVGGAVSTFYYATIPLICLCCLYDNYKEKKVHTENMEKHKQITDVPGI